MAVTNHYLGTVEEGSALITVPLEGQPGSPYLPVDAEVKLHGNTLPAFIPGLQAGLIAESATLASGKTVETAADTILWALEQLATATGD